MNRNIMSRPGSKAIEGPGDHGQRKGGLKELDNLSDLRSHSNHGLQLSHSQPFSAMTKLPYIDWAAISATRKCASCQL